MVVQLVVSSMSELARFVTNESNLLERQEGLMCRQTEMEVSALEPLNYYDQRPTKPTNLEMRSTS